MEYSIKGKKITNIEKAELAGLNHKWCSKCKSAKEYEQFAKSKQTADGYDGKCKNCSKQARLDNLEARKLKDKAYYEANKEVKLEYASNYRKENAEAVKASKSKHYYSKREYYISKNSEYRKRRYHSDPAFKCREIMRQHVKRALDFAKGRKTASSSKLLGYKPSDLKEHIESQFLEGMTWENHGEWHIDHIIPISRAKNIKDAIGLSQLYNLQPLWAEDNLEKGCRAD